MSNKVLHFWLRNNDKQNQGNFNKKYTFGQNETKLKYCSARSHGVTAIQHQLGNGYRRVNVGCHRDICRTKWVLMNPLTAIVSVTPCETQIKRNHSRSIASRKLCSTSNRHPM